MPEVWFKFFPRDWRDDQKLKDCRLASRSVWLEMCMIMREAEPFGFFVGHDGQTIDVAAFARKMNARPAEIRSAMSDLEAHGVFQRDSQRRIYSRRYVGEHARRSQNRENGLLGGNPAITNPVNRNPVNRSDYPNEPTPNGSNHIPLPDTDSLRSSAIDFGKWPEEIELLRGLSLIFVASFANCRDPLRAEKHIGPYTGLLAQMRGRNVTIADAWQACQDALIAAGRPLWGASIKTAMSFLPAKSQYGSRVAHNADLEGL